MQTTISTSPAPTPEQLRRMLARTSRAASPGNLQPWRFSWNGATLEITGETASEPSTLNHAGNVSAMTLGGLLEHLAIAATSEGFTADITLEAAGGPRVASAQFHEAGAADPLVDALAGRFTDRRDYRGGSLSAPVFQHIAADLPRYPACRLHLLPRTEVPVALLDYIVESEVFPWLYRPIHEQVLAMMRWTDAQAEQTRDGVPWRALELGPVAARLLALCPRWAMQAALNRLGFVDWIERSTRSALISAAGLGLITVGAVDRPALVEAGRLHTRAWLHLHAAGHALQPYTPASLYATESRLGLVPTQWPERTRRLFAGGLDLLRDAFGLDADEQPIWLFRAGVAPGPRPPGYYTYRRELTDLLHIAPDPTP